MLYLHGGGYIEQPVAEHWKFLDKAAAATGASITVPIYPKSPDYQYEDTFERLLSMYKSLLSYTDAKNTIFMGDSAGGGLALALAQYLLEKDLPQPGKLILLSPWLDITMENPDIPSLDSKDPSLGIYGLIQMGKAWAGGTDPHNYMLSPVYGSVLGLGEITVFVGGHEVLLPDIRKFKALTEKQNVKINYFEYPKMNHVFPLFPIPEAKKAQRQIFNIIKS
ncbi:MAG: alpha/beta hydrolase [Oscillospiraceae bacterium]